MPRGIPHGSSSDYAISELYGAIKQQIIFFAAETGTGAQWVAERISALLSPQRDRVLDHLPELRREAARISPPVEPLALAGDARSSQAPSGDEAQPSPPQKRSNSKVRDWWAKFTPEERSKIMNKRMKKWRPEAKAKWQNGRGAKAKGAKAKKERPKLNADEKHKKQLIYVARSIARKKGLPLPPLPKQLNQPPNPPASVAV